VPVEGGGEFPDVLLSVNITLVIVRFQPNLSKSFVESFLEYIKGQHP